jgi:hypothetical protein
VGPFGLCNGTFDGDAINLPVIITTLSIGVEIGIRTSVNCKDCVVCGENVGLLWRFLVLKWRRRWWIGFGLDLRVGVVWHGVCDLRHLLRVCYLWSWRRLRIIGCDVVV